MPNFTVDEIALINEQALPSADRPSYFSKEFQREQQIGQSFESFLILQKNSQKQISMDWIDRALDIEADNEDRDVLMTTYLEIVNEDAVARVEELDERLQDFGTFMTSLFQDESSTGGPSRFSDISELNIFVQSLQKPLDKLTVQRDQAFHEQNMITSLQVRLEQEQTDENSRAELESWNDILAIYKGQPGWPH